FYEIYVESNTYNINFYLCHIFNQSMNFFKALISWKLWLSIILGVALLVGLWFFTFKFLNEYTNHGVEVEVPDLSTLTIHEAIITLEDLNLRYEIDSVKFTEDYPLFAVLY